MTFVSPSSYDLDYPTVSFLDPSLLPHGQLDLPSTTSSIPSNILSLLGDDDDVGEHIAKYFQHAYTWLPFISKNRLERLFPLQPSPQNDSALLLLAIKLLTTSPPPRDPRTPLYHAVKHFYPQVENSAAFSILVLQAGVLVTLYEIAHAIYPAAFLSVAGCARYGHALGIDVNPRVPVRKPTTLVELEQRRRVWWAIVVLDRYASSWLQNDGVRSLISIIASSILDVQVVPRQSPTRTWIKYYLPMTQLGNKACVLAQVHTDIGRSVPLTFEADRDL